MKTLISAIQARLRSQLTYIRNEDVYVTPHENVIPPWVKFPAVGIKPGAKPRNESGYNYREVMARVRIAVYVQLRKDEEAGVMGDAAASQKGVLEIEEDVENALDRNFLSVSGVKDVRLTGSGETEYFGDERDALVRRIIDAEYELGESW